jgi:D-sedoheptulose 7-phosphate isomerase
MSPAGGIEDLYPFLYEGKADLAAVVAEVEQSTREKAREVMELRRLVGEQFRGELIECAVAMARCFQAGGKLFAFGNGGSATDAQAVAQVFLHPPAGPPLPAFSLTNDIAVITALSNDIGFDVVFARQIGAFGSKTDIALGLSTSGNSENVLRAFQEAARRGLLTVGFAGYAGGKMAEAKSIHHLFVVPSSSIPRIQEAQTTLYHVLWGLTIEAMKNLGPGTCSANGDADGD